MEDLQFVSTDELLNELCSRFDHCVFSSMKFYKNNQISKRKYKGDILVNFGLCTLARQFLIQEWLKQQKDIPECTEEM